jgi:hypothetical protein
VSTAALYSALSTSVDQRFAHVENQIKRAYAGVAMGFAMSAAPLSLGTGEQGISFGLGTFGGETSGALRYEARPTDKVFIGASIGVGDGQTGGAIGIGFKF